MFLGKSARYGAEQGEYRIRCLNKDEAATKGDVVVRPWAGAQDRESPSGMRQHETAQRRRPMLAGATPAATYAQQRCWDRFSNEGRLPRAILVFRPMIAVNREGTQHG